MWRSRRPAAFLGVLLAAGACTPGAMDPEVVDPAAVERGGRWLLHSGLVRHGAMGFEAPPGRLSEAAAARARRHVPAPLSLLPEATADGPRCVVLLSDDPRAAALLEPLGVEPLPDGGFRFAGRDHRAAGDALAATFADPERAGLPLSVWMGNDEDMLARHLSLVLPEWRPRVRVLLDGDVGYEVAVRADGTRTTSAPLLERRAELELLRTTPPDAEVGGLRLLSAVGERVPRDFAQRMAVARQSALDALGIGDAPAVDVLLFRHPSDMVAHTGSTAPWSVNPVSNRASTLFYRRFPRDGGAAAAAASAVAAVGPPAHPWLAEALGVQASWTWWGVSLGTWLAHLFRSDLVLPVEVLIAPDSDELHSPHRLVPLRALLVRHLVDVGGQDVLRRVWDGADPFPLVPALEAGFLESLARTTAKVPTRPDRRDSALPETLVRGVALAGPPEAFLQPRLRSSLLQAAKLGAGALSITVLASAAGEDVPVKEHAGAIRASLSDLAIAVAVREGRAQDLRVMLALQPLAATTGTWAEANALANSRNADRFFEEYSLLAEHYGLLAELLEIELLCIGAELGNIARTAPPAPGDRAAAEREGRARILARWRALVAHFRTVFRGGLTYAAESVWKAEEVGFWKDLDGVGVHLFPRMREAEGPPENPGALFHYHLGVLLELARELDLPALVVQAGYPSRAGGGDFAVPRGAIDPGVQSDVLLGLARALQSHERQPDGELLRMAFLWSWSPAPRELALDDGGFSPQGKVPRRTLRALLRR